MRWGEGGMMAMVLSSSGNLTGLPTRWKDSAYPPPHLPPLLYPTPLPPPSLFHHYSSSHRFSPPPCWDFTRLVAQQRDTSALTAHLFAAQIAQTCTRTEHTHGAARGRRGEGVCR